MRPLTVRYHILIARFPLVPLRADAELAEAEKVQKFLAGRVDLHPDERDYLDVLGLLIEDYLVRAEAGSDSDEDEPPPPEEPILTPEQQEAVQKAVELLDEANPPKKGRKK
jgi:hypothetical protein